MQWKGFHRTCQSLYGNAFPWLQTWLTFWVLYLCGKHEIKSCPIWQEGNGFASFLVKVSLLQTFLPSVIVHVAVCACGLDCRLVKMANVLTNELMPKSLYMPNVWIVGHRTCTQPNGDFLNFNASRIHWILGVLLVHKYSIFRCLGTLLLSSYGFSCGKDNWCHTPISDVLSLMFACWE